MDKYYTCLGLIGQHHRFYITKSGLSEYYAKDEKAAFKTDKLKIIIFIISIMKYLKTTILIIYYVFFVKLRTYFIQNVFNNVKTQRNL